ncbi:MAG TPA: glycoside hydrolase [Bacteroidales bacterium]|nr:glycoside hydrolase [Bacteroidales bacterium]
MRKRTILTIVAGVILTSVSVHDALSQTPNNRPVPVPYWTGAATTEASSKSTGTIDWTKTAQEIDGFGASGAFRQARNLMNFPEPQRSEVLDILFSTDKGAGLSIVRNIVGDGGTVGGASPTYQPKEGVFEWTGDEDQIWLMKEAEKRGCTRFMSTVWSPPAWMKDNNNVVGGRLRPDKYLAFAEYLSMYIRGYKEHHGIDIYAISIANEPDVNVRYSSCHWSGKEFHDFLTFLIPVFERDKITAKVILGEHSGWTENPVLESLADSVTAKRVDIVGVHAYNTEDKDPFPPLSQRSGQLVETLAQKKKIWETEVSNLGRNYPDIRDGLYWAKMLNTHVAENNANAWLYWWAVTSPTSGQGMAHLDSQNKTYAIDKRLYTMGNYSRFVRPGYFRVPLNLELSAGVTVSAYKNENDKKLVVVVINENVTARKVEFSLTGAAAAGAAQYRTSEKENLVSLPELQIKDNLLKATLAPYSVTTFVMSVNPS